MNTESTAVTTPVIDENEVAREATPLIAAAAIKHGYATSEIAQDVVDRSHAEARALLKCGRKHKADPYFGMYNDAARRADLAEAQLKALRESSGTRPQGNIIVETAERARARAGEVGWSRMTVEQRLASIGVDHRTVDKAEISRFFGRDSDHKAASDLHRTDQRKYKVLKETAKVLGIL